MNEYCHNHAACTDKQHCDHSADGEVLPHAWDEYGTCLFCPWRRRDMERTTSDAPTST